MDRDATVSVTNGSWRYKIGGWFLAGAVVTGTMSVMAFPKRQPFSIETIDQLHRSALIAIGTLVCLVIGLALIVSERIRRYELSVEAASPVDRATYLAILESMSRRANQHPTSPVDPAQVRQLLELLENTDVPDNAGYKLLDR